MTRRWLRSWSYSIKNKTIRRQTLRSQRRKKSGKHKEHNLCAFCISTVKAVDFLFEIPGEDDYFIFNNESGGAERCNLINLH